MFSVLVQTSEAKGENSQGKSEGQRHCMKNVFSSVRKLLMDIITEILIKSFIQNATSYVVRHYDYNQANVIINVVQP